jgi:DNA-binding transcriptional regulator WhiA
MNASFSRDVRLELAALEHERACCQTSELSALLAVNGHAWQDGAWAIALDLPATARRVFRLAKAHRGLVPELSHETPDGRSGALSVILRPEDGFSLDVLAVDLRGLRRRCCRRSFLRGLFLGCGSLVNPERAYHLEFTLQDDMLAPIQGAFDAEHLHHGAYQRAGGQAWTCYLKRSDDIAAFLTLTGAGRARYALEDLRVSRDLKNHVQRTVNCETANLDRTLQTAAEQIRAIEALVRSGALSSVSEELAETARIRVDHPYASLAQLAALHAPPLSKSAINHRLRRLVAMTSGWSVPDTIPGVQGENRGFSDRDVMRPGET